MHNKEKFFKNLKDVIFKSKEYENKIAKIKKEKNIVNEKIKECISANKTIFKKKKISDIFTEYFLLKCFIFVPSSLFFIFLASFVINRNLDLLRIGILSLAIFATLFFSTPIIFNIKSEKRKVFSKLKCLHGNNRSQLRALKNINLEKENIERMLKDFENNDSNMEIMNFPVSVDFMKTIGSYFSEKEIERMMFDKDNEAITYYDLIKFVYKNENLEHIKKQAHQIKEMVKSKDVIA